MRASVVVAAAFISLTVGVVAGQTLYAPAGDIAIGGPLPAQWDYQYVDSAARRLYVSHNAEVVVIDTATDTVVGRIGETPGVHGIAVGAGRVFTSNGRENKVSIVDPKTLQTLSKADSGGANPDAITFDPAKQEVWVFNHTGHSATQMDASGKIVATVPLSGVAETGQVDAAAGRVYVNIEDKDSVDVIDVASKKVAANWPVAPAASPTGMALVAGSHRLLVGGGPNMVMIDTATGKVVASVPICSGTDSTWYDPGTQLAFASCRDGKITVAHMDSPEKLTVVQTIETSPGSRTMALDSSTHKLYVAAARPLAGARGNDPNSFHVLVFARK